MSTVVVAATGVLRDDNKRVIPEGKRMVQALGEEHYRVVVALDDADVDLFSIWAKMEGLTAHQEVIPATVPGALRGYDERVAQVEYLKGRGEHVVLVVDSDPTRIAEIMKHGVIGLLFCNPGVMRPEYRPDYDATPRRWDDLVAEIETAHYKVTVGEE